MIKKKDVEENIELGCIFLRERMGEDMGVIENCVNLPDFPW